LGVPSAVPWGEVFELQVVKTAAKLVERRWGMGLGFADAAGSVRPPRGRNQCTAVQSREAGEKKCQEHAKSALESLRLAGGRNARCGACHAGVSEIAAPLVVEGEVVGALLCGGLERAVSEPEAAAIAALLEEVAAAVADEIGDRVAHRVHDELAAPYRTRYSYDAIIGRAPPMQELYRLLDRVAHSDSTVLIQGENGTGKELVARAIHYNSARKGRRFVVQNCSAFNDNLLDSELFGHRRGAFTGAIADKQGLFEVADEGTFFLDEIGDMSPSLQVKVLRVLQEGTFTAVGDTDPRKVDVRIIAATNRDLKGMVERGAFREDLYYRIHVINMVIPPLRERPDDIDLLVDHFLVAHGRGRRSKRLSEACRARLRAYPWPGNVRELENEIERLLVLSGDDRTIEEGLLSTRMRQEPEERAASSPPSEEGAGGNLPGAIESLERRMIGASLARHLGNKTRAAEDLGISRRNLIRLVQKYGL
jgi:two-component system, NtrC family, response regulator HupR/HoxA